MRHPRIRGPPRVPSRGPRRPTRAPHAAPIRRRSMFRLPHEAPPNQVPSRESQAIPAIQVLSGRALSATGVTYLKGGQLLSVTARREVILCAGAVQSPQILELSGIGRPEILRKLGIE